MRVVKYGENSLSWFIFIRVSIFDYLSRSRVFNCVYVCVWICVGNKGIWTTMVMIIMLMVRE